MSHVPSVENTPLELAGILLPPSSPAPRCTLPAVLTAPPNPPSLTLRLFTSHFLSTWNSRFFEFGAVLFLAGAFPTTLLPVSVYALVRSGSAVLLAQPVGAWIDYGNRLNVVRASIVGQRAAVAGSCGAFWALEARRKTGASVDGDDGNVFGSAGAQGLFALVTVLACVEKLCSTMNLVSVERDWVVVMTEGREAERRTLNARMRRIDLFCKLVGPLAISAIAAGSTLAAIWATLGMNVLSILVECIFAEQVFRRVPQLRRARSPPSSPTGHAPSSLLSSAKSLALAALPVSSLRFYFRHRAFAPSFALSLLYLTVLSFSGQMITYLMSVGYSALWVGVARTASTVCELSATWIAPRLARRLGPVRTGIWSLSWQMVWLAAGVSWLFARGAAGNESAVGPATGLAVGVAVSRVGLWGFDLSAQNIVQDEVEDGRRGAFSSAEAGFQNLFDMLSYVTTVVFSRPDQFRWPVVVSVAAVYTASAIYAAYVRRVRGHLFHAPPCVPFRAKS